VEIRVTCEGAGSEPLENLSNFQGDLKSITPENLGKLKNRLVKHGINVPVFVWVSGAKSYIMDGHQRVAALRSLQEDGYEIPDVPVAYIQAKNRKDAKEKLLGITSQYGDFSKQGLIDFVDGITFEDIRLTTGDLDLTIEDIEFEPETEVDAPPQFERGRELVAHYGVEEGKVWILGKHRIACGDSENPAIVEAALGGSKPLIMVTDPPYGVDYDPTWRRGAGLSKNELKMAPIQNDSKPDWRGAWKLFPGNVAYVYHAGVVSDVVKESLEAASFDIRSQIIWVKDRMALSRGDYHWMHEPCWYGVRKGKKSERTKDRTQNTIWDISTGERAGSEAELIEYLRMNEIDLPHWLIEQISTVWRIKSREDKGHGVSTQKPVECMGRALRNHDFKLVYDPFIGSGTTIIAAERQHRGCIAIDVNPENVAISIQRWVDATGGTPELAI
jgi:DNA modification methylase